MDKRAKKILFSTYWKNGWIDNSQRTITRDDFQYAKEKGLMFDPLTTTHDRCLHDIIAMLSDITVDLVATAFLSSLSSRRLDLRSGLASYFIAKQLTPHVYTSVLSGQSYDLDGNITHTSYTCGVCRDLKYGIIGRENYHDIDLNVLNFERIKWGGVRHGALDYTLFDLQQLRLADIPQPSADDVSILNAILATIAASKPDDYPSMLEKNLATVIKSTKDERKVLIEILACIGVLQPRSYERPSRGKHDWTYVTYWRGEDKFNPDAVSQYFGRYL